MLYSWFCAWACSRAECLSCIIAVRSNLNRIITPYGTPFKQTVPYCLWETAHRPDKSCQLISYKQLPAQRHIVRVLRAHTPGVCQQHHTWQAATRRQEMDRQGHSCQQNTYQEDAEAGWDDECFPDGTHSSSNTYPPKKHKSIKGHFPDLLYPRIFHYLSSKGKNFLYPTGL